MRYQKFCSIFRDQCVNYYKVPHQEDQLSLNIPRVLCLDIQMSDRLLKTNDTGFVGRINVQRQRQSLVFPITWLKKVGSVGRNSFG